MTKRIAELESRTRFDPAEVESRISERWLQSGLFHPEAEGEAGKNYSIAIPPPNITGSLHMGHALNGSIQDVLIRYQRMRAARGSGAGGAAGGGAAAGGPVSGGAAGGGSRRVKWILGTDHAGIATQTQVEKTLLAEGSSRRQIGREAFVERVWDWREHYGHTIVEQLKRLGASCDYAEERFTLDEGYARAVVEVFVRMYEKGWIYRDRYIVNWDPGSRSAISDLEVEQRRDTDTLYSIRYDLEDLHSRPAAGQGPGSGGGSVTIATVRPETMLGDTAVAVHPDDERYRDLVGRSAILPLVGRHLPIVADDYVKMDFGTGQLKITPAHDPNDFEIGRRHDLDQVSVIGEDGCMTAEAGERFAGLPVLRAREAVVEALRAEGRIVAEEPYEHEVPYSHRSGERIEPLISLQWFMDMDELSKPAAAAVIEGRVRIVPDNHRRVYLDWMEGIRPWCISRQLWWGHRLPVYYCETCGHVNVAVTAPEGCSECGGHVRQDEDVLDTWFSSALWPFATLGWPEQTPQLRAFYPTAVLSTARDILFLWVARMIMMGLELTGQAPFSDVYIHSVIQAPDGRRMSKSLGTGIDPLDEIDRHGADAVRFGLLAMSSTQDVRYSAEKVQQGQALANKLFNATRFALTRIHASLGPEAAAAVRPEPRPRTVEDRWILSRLAQILSDTAARIEDYDFSHAALGLYDFVYGELCDWYVELVKHRLPDRSDGDPAEALRERTDLAATLLHVLRHTVALAHPLIPFVTEELWSYLEDSDLDDPGTLLAGSAYPRADETFVDLQAEVCLERAIEAVVAVRGWRDSVGARAGVTIRARLCADGYDVVGPLVARMARLSFEDGGPGGVGGRGGDGGGDGRGEGEGRGSGEDGGAAAPVAQIPVPGGTIEVLSAEGLDLQAAERRRAAAREKIEAELARVRAKLENAGFVAKAPAAVVEGERERLQRLTAELEAL